MRLIKFDSVGGASGDMILGSLIALGADIGAIRESISKALPEESFDLSTENFSSHGLNGVKLKVEIHEHHHHHHEHHHEHEHESHHHGRHLKEIESLIESSSLPKRVKDLSRAVFLRLGEAEAKVHQIPLENVHFHEVGAVDSIIDIIGSCLALDLLKVDAISFGPLPEGKGTFKCQHGVYPIPAPATAELLKDFEVVFTDEPFEMVTPTGAALLTSLPKVEGQASGKPVANAISFGSRKLNGRPNALRATLLESSDSIEPGLPGSCTLIETNLDDLSPEICGALFEKVLSEGALDVWTTPATMKKQRQGSVISILCESNDRIKFEHIAFKETGSFGLRVREVERRILERRFEKISTPFGEISIKCGFLDGNQVSSKPEFEDCLKLAKSSGVPVKDVIRAAIASYEKSKGQP